MVVAQEEERLGWQQVERGRLDEAELHFRRALELDPFRADALNGLGVIWMSWGELEHAQEFFQMAIAQAQLNLPRRKRHTGWEDANIRPYLRGLYHLAGTWVQQGLWEDAREPLEELLAWDPSGMNGEASYLAGQMYHRLGEWEEALAYYEAALERHPIAYYSMGLVYYEVERLKEADRAWAKALGVAPEACAFIAHFPQVIPIPLGEPVDDSFVVSSQYVRDNIDLWGDGARARIRAFCGRQSK